MQPAFVNFFVSAQSYSISFVLSTFSAVLRHADNPQDRHLQDPGSFRARDSGPLRVRFTQLLRQDPDPAQDEQVNGAVAGNDERRRVHEEDHHFAGKDQ